MGIIKEFRGQGIGERLITATINAAKDLGLKRIELEVYAKNENAIKLYKKVGFLEEGRKRKAVFMNGEYFDELLMAKLMFEKDK